MKPLEEKVTPEEISTQDFELKDKLEPQIWDSEDKLNEKVKNGLLKIVSKYIEFLDLPKTVTPEDIVLTGSIANYNYTKFSDLDVHIIIDYSKLGEDHDLLLNYFKDKKDLWSDRYKITIHGFPVELFAQDKNEKNSWSAAYSIKDDKWLNKPEMDNPEINNEEIKEKASVLVNKIDDIIESEPSEKTSKEINDIWDDIKKMRQSALQKDGELSTDNLVFRYLRNYGYLEKLEKYQEEATKKTLSIAENKEIKKTKKITISEEQYQKLKSLYKK